MSFDEALARAGTWSALLRDDRASTAAKREVLAELIERVEPVRVAFGKYRVDITKWTAAGDTLQEIAARASVTAGAKRAGRRSAAGPRVRVVK